jgi:anti-sigma regulatory factor (Ser/Thr protein kinase)
MPEIMLQAKKENLTTLMEFVDSVAKKIGFTKSALYKIKLASEEAIINIINHAYPDNEGHITVICDEITEPKKGLKLHISDTGVAFNPLTKVDPDTNQPIDERSIGGLGIYLIKKTANELFYERDGNMNSLIIIFYLPNEK